MADQLSSDLASLRIDRPTQAGPKRSWGGTVATVVVIGALAAGAAVAYPRLAATMFKQEISMTEIALISPAQASISITSSGYVVPQVLSRVGAKIPGRIAKVM